MSHEITPFESIRRTNPAGNEFWSSRDFAKVLGYADYRNFQSVIESARTACLNSGQLVEDHFVDVTDMIEVGKGAKVRQTIKELGGTMPEELPPAESIRKLESKARKALKRPDD